MSYEKWFDEHSCKHAEIMERLKNLTTDEVIEYFRFENMQKNEPYFCPLYAKNTKCHDIEELNCYLCACPNFRFDDEGFKKIEERNLKSFCSIESKKGALFKTDDAIHQDCSSCDVPHKKKYIKTVFSRDWKHMMKDVML